MNHVAGGLPQHRDAPKSAKPPERRGRGDPGGPGGDPSFGLGKRIPAACLEALNEPAYVNPFSHIVCRTYHLSVLFANALARRRPPV
jgi:hypothetical protein